MSLACKAEDATGCRQVQETRGNELRIMAVIDDLAAGTKCSALSRSIIPPEWKQSAWIPEEDDDFINCWYLARAAWKCREPSAAYPPHRSTQSKGQRALMNIWCKRSSSARCLHVFVPPLIYNQWIYPDHHTDPVSSASPFPLLWRIVAADIMGKQAVSLNFN